MSLPVGAVGWSVVYDCGVTETYSLAFQWEASMPNRDLDFINKTRSLSISQMAAVS